MKGNNKTNYELFLKDLFNAYTDMILEHIDNEDIECDFEGEGFGQHWYETLADLTIDLSIQSFQDIVFSLEEQAIECAKLLIEEHEQNLSEE
ncbi:hypothetical protein UFOVP264_32 [uncultured Caudovirales phage]|uniref:Uncharacterized protein n=1 Tax=uncultured Caudovirales phage TaxID=2100421 RepID=A0A6J5LJT0_9CAUD|nr:hypothetical protein UFOVP264_32 [uncultured Caudovirales phage]